MESVSPSEAGKGRGVRVRRSVLQAAALLALGMAVGIAIHETRAPTLPWVGSWSAESLASRHLEGLVEVSLEDATALWREGRALFLDARDPGSYRAGHLPGAMNIPPEEAEAAGEEVKVLVEAGLEPIAYCDGVDCPLSPELARRLQAQGVRSVKVLVNGWSRWRGAGLPTEGR
jgi:rhodanese-related sulfurtransferase